MMSRMDSGRDSSPVFQIMPPEGNPEGFKLRIYSKHCYNCMCGYVRFKMTGLCYSTCTKCFLTQVANRKIIDGLNRSNTCVSAKRRNHSFTEAGTVTEKERAHDYSWTALCKLINTFSVSYVDL